MSRIVNKLKKVMGIGATVSIVQPATLTAPIASQGAYVAPLTTPDPNIASLPLGYPPSQAEQLSSGGVPVDIKQTNGFWNLLSQFIVWINTGGQWTFDPAVVTANGGYNKGQILWCASVQRYLLSLVNNNTANFLTNPNYINDGVNWAFAELPSIKDDLAGNITISKALTAGQGNFSGLLTALAGLAISGAGTLNNKNIATTDMIVTYPDIVDNVGTSVNIAVALSVAKNVTALEGTFINGITTPTNIYPATGRPQFNGSSGATLADVSNSSTGSLASQFQGITNINTLGTITSQFAIQSGSGVTGSNGIAIISFTSPISNILNVMPTIFTNGVFTSLFISVVATTSKSVSIYVQREGSTAVSGVTVKATIVGFV